MRISDWMSYVCSSDLGLLQCIEFLECLGVDRHSSASIVHLAAIQAHKQLNILIGKKVLASLGFKALGTVPGNPGKEMVVLTVELRQHFDQTGRESDRDRVCQYV